MIDFIHSELQFFILCLTTFFTLINPIGIAPLLLMMTERFSKEERGCRIRVRNEMSGFYRI